VLILFDIDGTLLLSQGAGKRAMVEAGRDLHGPSFTMEGIDFSGRLDPLIWADACRINGIDDTPLTHGAFRKAYHSRLRQGFAEGGRAWSLPGVVNLLLALQAESSRATIGVLTGNYAETGRMKISQAGLDPGAFRVAAWGDEGRTRRDLPPVAIGRYRNEFGPIDSGDVIIIGDTPHDIDCARASGCRCIAVGTGPGQTMEILQTHAPDLLLPTLEDTDEIIRWVFGEDRSS